MKAAGKTDRPPSATSTHDLEHLRPRRRNQTGTRCVVTELRQPIIQGVVVAFVRHKDVFRTAEPCRVRKRAGPDGHIGATCWLPEQVGAALAAKATLCLRGGLVPLEML